MPTPGRTSQKIKQGGQARDSDSVSHWGLVDVYCSGSEPNSNLWSLRLQLSRQTADGRASLAELAGRCAAYLALS